MTVFVSSCKLKAKQASKFVISYDFADVERVELYEV